MFNLASTFSPSDFLAQYWQKQPVVIRQALVDFVDPLDEHDLAGLAMEDEVDSRIVRQDQGANWHVEHGPFTDFTPFCIGKWTLLVQGVERYVEDVDRLMSAFDFIPYWRMDDVMVSFAVPGAGVGAHTDQYDVFLIQGKGKRRWRVGRPGKHHTHAPHKDLQQIAPFHPVIDVELNPGDILYIPPGWPHDGVTIENSLTYSIGFRAPDQNDILQQVAELVSTQNKTATRYTDPQLTSPSHPAMIKQTEISALKSMLMDYLNSEQSTSALLTMLSDQHLPEYYVDTAITPKALITALENGASLHRVNGCKPLFREIQSTQQFEFFINGEQFHTSAEHQPLLNELFRGVPLFHETLVQAKVLDDFAFIELLSILVKKGYWQMMD
ncbi:cupin domain-containing protein [Aestuariibacter sp. A3R04]|uniref:JmjC domain-containing protein n=1 Tax=Aestuariibacter sp. A3R04 TaxID=2841571 RepID=UPI001C088EAD|nr:cupin domain-containing protein [Aestuariibacter sp. A3R04]